MALLYGIVLVALLALTAYVKNPWPLLLGAAVAMAIHAWKEDWSIGRGSRTDECDGSGGGDGD